MKYIFIFIDKIILIFINIMNLFSLLIIYIVLIIWNLKISMPNELILSFKQVIQEIRYEPGLFQLLKKL